MTVPASYILDSLDTLADASRGFTTELELIACQARAGHLNAGQLRAKVEEAHRALDEMRRAANTMKVDL